MALYLDTTIQSAKVSIRLAPRACIKSEAFDITLLIYGIAARSATMGATFLDLPVRVAVLPRVTITALGMAAVVAGLIWLLRSSIAFARGTLDTLYFGFVLSHVAIFLVAYVGIEDANTGWLAIDVWHNFQYVLLAWMMNQKKSFRNRSA